MFATHVVIVVVHFLGNPGDLKIKGRSIESQAIQ